MSHQYHNAYQFMQNSLPSGGGQVQLTDRPDGCPWPEWPIVSASEDAVAVTDHNVLHQNHHDSRSCHHSVTSLAHSRNPHTGTDCLYMNLHTASQPVSHSLSWIIYTLLTEDRHVILTNDTAMIIMTICEAGLHPPIQH